MASETLAYAAFVDLLHGFGKAVSPEQLTTSMFGKWVTVLVCVNLCGVNIEDPVGKNCGLMGTVLKQMFGIDIYEVIHAKYLDMKNAMNEFGAVGAVGAVGDTFCMILECGLCIALVWTHEHDDVLKEKHCRYLKLDISL